MTDNPYVIDFLQQVVDVQFGGQWFGILTSTPINRAFLASVKINFPGIAGGTPGFNPIIAAVPDQSYHLRPYTVKLPDLSAQLRTLAGAAVTGFGTRTDPTQSLPSVEMFFKFDRFFPHSPFAVSIQHIYPSFVPGQTGGFVQVFTVAKNGMKVGLDTSAPPIANQASDNFVGLGGTHTYQVDPTTLAVTRS